MVELFKTNVQEVAQSEKLIGQLLVLFPKCRINFDLDDCDKILRIEGHNIFPETIIEILNTNGYKSEILF